LLLIAGLAGSALGACWPFGANQSLHAYSRAVDNVYLITAIALSYQWGQVSPKLRPCVDSFTLINSSEP
jgi:hypothetical protein